MSSPLGILPHRAFVDSVEASDFDQYQRDPRTRVRNSAAFARMQEHIVSLNSGVDAVHSFEDSAGHPFDCIPVAQQPSLKGGSGRLPNPPDLTPVLRGGDPVAVSNPWQPPIGRPTLDRHGNARQAPPGTIPIRRITLDQVVRFHDLDDFFRKYPTGTVGRGRRPAGQRSRKGRSSKESSGPNPSAKPSVPDPNPDNNHRYAYADQTIDNLGAHAALALYAPLVNSDQVFSLAQHWYSGGTGAAHQTVELGWQVYPDMYGHASPVLFVFWTPDNYVSGAYNLAKPGFVQTNGNWAMGSALSPTSVVGGQQWEMDLAVYLFQGNWWIYSGGTAASDTIGYYPTSLFGNGQMASKATDVVFGGETVTKQVSWPAMGSGGFASAGWQQAAYQRQIYLFPTAGGAQWAGLTEVNPSASCYTLVKGMAAQPWGAYFFYGGPGGGNC